MWFFFVCLNPAQYRVLTDSLLSLFAFGFKSGLYQSCLKINYHTEQCSEHDWPSQQVSRYCLTLLPCLCVSIISCHAWHMVTLNTFPSKRESLQCSSVENHIGTTIEYLQPAAHGKRTQQVLYSSGCNIFGAGTFWDCVNYYYFQIGVCPGPIPVVLVRGCSSRTRLGPESWWELVAVRAAKMWRSEQKEAKHNVKHFLVLLFYFSLFLVGSHTRKLSWFPSFSRQMLARTYHIKDFRNKHFSPLKGL